MEPSSKQQQQRSQKTKRRDRAARMLRQKQQLGRASSRGGGGGGGVRGGEDLSENEGDESPLRREKRPPPPTRKKRNKEPLFQEDIIDGFAFLCFKTYEDLEKTVNKLSGKSSALTETGCTETGVPTSNETTPIIDDSLPQLEKQKTTPNKANKKANNANHRVKKKNILNNKANRKEASLSRSGDEIIKRSGDKDDENDRQHRHKHKNQQNQPPRTASRDQLSDASSHASLERGYLCDSESGNERGSEPECDLFSSKSDSTYIAKKNNPGHSNSCRSPPVLPPIHPVVVQNGSHHHPEPSTAAVAAVTANASPANTVSAMAVGSASPREPQIGSPAVLPIACPSPASPPAGVVPPSQPPFLQKGPSPATVPTANVSNEKDVENTSGNKLISNGYEAVSDTSPPPSPLAKLLSPSKFLHRRPGGPPGSSCRLEQGAAAVAVAPSNKPSAINVYDFVSDHSAPSSPDGVVFISQLKSHHSHHHAQHHAPPHHLHKGANSMQQPLPPSAPLANKPVSLEAVNVSNGHSMMSGVCPPSPMVHNPSALQNSHKSALDMSMKSVNGPQSAVKSMLTATSAPPPTSMSSDHRHHHQLSQQQQHHQPSLTQQQQQHQQQQQQQQHHHQQQQQQQPPPPSHSQNQHHHPPPQQQQQQSSRSSSYSIPYSTSQQHPVVRKISSPRRSPLPISMSLSSTSLQSSPSLTTVASSLSSGTAPVVSGPPVSTRTFVTTTSTTLSSSISSSSQSTPQVGSIIGPMGLRCSPAVTTSHPNTPTPIPPRDTHSSHSNSSLSSLSQLSNTPVCHKDGSTREGGSRSSHSNSGHHTPSTNLGPSATAASSSSTAYTATSSLASLVFSKPHTWGSSSGPTHTTASSHVSPLPSRSSPNPNSSLPLPPSLPPAHHTSPFGNHPGPPPPPLLPVASHHGIFGPGSLTPTLPMDATTGPSPYRAEALFQQPSKYPDLLRRELDTRFLASQDHSIPIPPPPYMQTEVHQHGPLHQQPTFIGPPSLGAPLVTQPTPHLYEKYPKLDSALYGRPSIGLSGYPPVSALFAPGGGASTPFAPPAHLTALQPKINSVPKTKSLKPGKWCAMHVRIAWEIYNHQQKQKRAEAHKAGMVLAAAAKPPPELHANHLFSLPRQHDLSFSSSLLSAAASAHPRSFETSSHHSTFLNPTPAHLGPFSRPGYPSFGGPGPGFSGLGPLGLPGSAVLGTDLRSGCLPQDPWSQRTALSFAGNPPWGGLKEEAERDRLQQEQRKREEERKRAEQERREKEERERREHERREQERREMERREHERKEQERKERERKEHERREMERREMERREHERREQERQKERDREIRLHHQMQKSSAIVMNGDLRDHHLHPHLQHHAHLAREWERVRESREHPRSPVQLNAPKYETGLERQPPQQSQQTPQQQFYGNPRLDVKVKQERKDDEPPQPVVRSHRTSNIPEDRSSRKRPSSMEPEDLVAHTSRGVSSHTSLPPSLGLGPHGLVQSPAKDPMSHSQASPLWGPLTPSPTVSSLSGPAVDHYRSREMLQARGPESDRRFDPLMSVMSSQRDRCASNELSRQLSNAIDLERQFLDREHAAAAAAHAAAYDRVKLLPPPPLRTNESPYMTPPTLPPASASSFFSPPVSPYLNSLCPTAPGRSKVQGPPPSVINGLPPPLIPCTFPVQNPGFPATNRTSSPMAHKLAQVTTSSVLNLHHDSYFPKDRREVNGHPADLDPHLRL